MISNRSVLVNSKQNGRKWRTHRQAEGCRHVAELVVTVEGLLG